MIFLLTLRHRFCILILISLLSLHLFLSPSHSHSVFTASHPISVPTTVIEWSRQLRTCDVTDDVDIELSGTTKIIYAHNKQQTGLSSSDDSHPGPQYHGVSTRGTINVNFFDASTSFSADLPPTHTVSLMIRPVTLPTSETTYYHCQAIQNDWGTNKKHGIIFTANLNFTNRAVYHHILLMKCPSSVRLTPSDLAFSGPCYGQHDLSDTLNQCNQVGVVAGWGVGGGPLVLPPETGYPFQGLSNYLIQIHYNNPSLLPITDSSGINITYVEDPYLRQYDCSTLEFGREISSISIPPNNSSFIVEAYLSPTILQSANSVGSLNATFHVFASFLHTHLLGSAVRISQFRGGKYITDIDYNPRYDFSFQQSTSFHPTKLATIEDTWQLTCQYNSMGRTGETLGGLSITHEMCQVYLYYYPAADDPLTKVTSYPVPSLTSNARITTGQNPFHYSFGKTHGNNLQSVSQMMNSLPLPPLLLLPCKPSTNRHDYTIGTYGTQYLPLSIFNPSAYSRRVTADVLGEYVLYWNITMDDDGMNGIIKFAAQVQTDGWVGLGVSLSGGMAGADVVIGWVDSVLGTVSLLDRKSTQEGLPHIDGSAFGSSQDIWDVKGYYGLYPQSPPAPNVLYYNYVTPTRIVNTESSSSSSSSPSGGNSLSSSSQWGIIGLVILLCLIVVVIVVLIFLRVYSNNSAVKWSPVPSSAPISDSTEQME